MITEFRHLGYRGRVSSQVFCFEAYTKLRARTVVRSLRLSTQGPFSVVKILFLRATAHLEIAQKAGLQVRSQQTLSMRAILRPANSISVQDRSPQSYSKSTLCRVMRTQPFSTSVKIQWQIQRSPNRYLLPTPSGHFTSLPNALPCLQAASNEPPLPVQSVTMQRLSQSFARCISALLLLPSPC